MSETNFLRLAERIPGSPSAKAPPVLTFDIRDFRAAPRPDGTAWPLLVDEEAFARLTA